MVSDSDYAAMADAAYQGAEKNPDNIPPTTIAGWTNLTAVPGLSTLGGTTTNGATTLASGLEYRAYTDGTDIVISFAGTKFADGSLALADFLNGNIPLTAGASSPELDDAVRVYEAVKAQNAASQTPKAISFTGHSLGGGLASVMGALFDVPTTVFDPASFGLSLVSPTILGDVGGVLSSLNTTDAAFAAYRAEVTQAWGDSPVFNVIGGLQSLPTFGLGTTLSTPVLGAVLTALRGIDAQLTTIVSDVMNGEILTKLTALFPWVGPHAVNTLVGANLSGTDIFGVNLHSMDLMAACQASQAFAAGLTACAGSVGILVGGSSPFAGDAKGKLLLTALLDAASAQGSTAILDAFGRQLTAASKISDPAVRQLWQYTICDKFYQYALSGSSTAPPTVLNADGSSYQTSDTASSLVSGASDVLTSYLPSFSQADQYALAADAKSANSSVSSTLQQALTDAVYDTSVDTGSGTSAVHSLAVAGSGAQPTSANSSDGAENSALSSTYWSDVVTYLGETDSGAAPTSSSIQFVTGSSATANAATTVMYGNDAAGTTLNGGAGSTVYYLPAGNEFNGGSGLSKVVAGDNVVINGSTGNLFIKAGQTDVITLGSGAALVEAQQGDVISSSSGSGLVTLDGKQLFGGAWNPATNTYQSANGLSYQIQGSNLVVTDSATGNAITLTNVPFGNSVSSISASLTGWMGISLVDLSHGTAQDYGIPAISSTSGVSASGYSFQTVDGGTGTVSLWGTGYSQTEFTAGDGTQFSEGVNQNGSWKQISVPGGETSSWMQAPDGAITVWVSNPGSSVENYAYTQDPSGLLSSAGGINSNGNTVGGAYDASTGEFSGGVYAVVDGVGTPVIAYNNYSGTEAQVSQGQSSFTEQTGVNGSSQTSQAGSASSKLIQHTDGSYETDTVAADGSTTKLVYSAQGALLSSQVTNASDNTSSSSFIDAQGNTESTQTNADGSTTSSVQEPDGATLSSSYSNADGSHGSFTTNSDGSTAGADYATDGSYTAYFNGVDGSSWTQSFNSQHVMTASTTTNSDGSKNTYALDTSGDQTWESFAADGSLLSTNYQNTDGSHGIVQMNPDGTSYSAIYAADGSYTVDSVDSSGSHNQWVYSAAGVETGSTYLRADGSSGSYSLDAAGDQLFKTYNTAGDLTSSTYYGVDGSRKVFNLNPDGTTTETDTAADNSYQVITTTVTGTAVGISSGLALTASGGAGFVLTVQHDTLGRTISANYKNADGSYGTYQLNADGSSSQLSYSAVGVLQSSTIVNADGSYATYVLQSDGTGVTTSYANGWLTSTISVGVDGTRTTSLYTNGVLTSTATTKLDGSGTLTQWSGGETQTTVFGAGQIAISGTYVNNYTGTHGDWHLDAAGDKIGHDTTSLGQLTFYIDYVSGVSVTTTYAADGKTKVGHTQSNPDGSSSTWVLNGDGSQLSTTRKADGSSIQTLTQVDGSTDTQKLSAQGQEIADSYIRSNGEHGYWSLNAAGDKIGRDYDSQGGYTLYDDYAAGGSVVNTYAADGTTELSHSARAADGSGTSWVKNADGSVESDVYNADGSRRAVVRGADGSTDTQVYSAGGFQVSDAYVGVDGSRESWQLDTAGDILGRYTDSDGGVTLYTEYATGGELVNVYSASGVQIEHEQYNGDGSGSGWTKNSDGSTSRTTQAADGSSTSSLYASDGAVDTDIYSSTGQETRHTFTAYDGSRAVDTLNAFGTWDSVWHKSDGTYGETLNKVDGSSLSQEFSAAGTLMYDYWQHADGSWGVDYKSASGTMLHESFAANVAVPSSLWEQADSVSWLANAPEQLTSTLTEAGFKGLLVHS